MLTPPPSPPTTPVLVHFLFYLYNQMHLVNIINKNFLFIIFTVIVLLLPTGVYCIYSAIRIWLELIWMHFKNLILVLESNSF